MSDVNVMEISNSCEEGEFCVVTISLPVDNEIGSSQSQGIHTTDNDHCEDYSKTSILCPPGTQLISLEDANEYFFTSQKLAEDGTSDEIGGTINYIIQEGDNNSNSPRYYTVAVPQDVIEEPVELEEQQILEIDDNQYVPESSQQCDYNVNVQETIYQCDEDEEVQHLSLEDGNVHLYEEHTSDYIQSEVDVEHTDTLVYSNGSVYVLRQQHEQGSGSDQQDSHCDNVLQEYGYVFVNEEEEEEEELPNHNEEGEEEKVDVETLGEVVSALKCVSCHFTTLDKALLIQHHTQVHCCGVQDVESKGGKKEGEHVVYVCGQCSVELPSVETCKQHMILEHKLLGGSSSIPDILQQLPKEKNRTETEEKYEDNNSIKINGNISPERERQGEEKSVVSPAVDKRLRQYWLHHGTSQNVKARLCSDRKIRCTMRKCDYRFSTRDKMEKHKLCHTAIQEDTQPLYTCTDCDATFAKWPQCSLHLHKNHNISLDIILCPLCSSYPTHSVRVMATHLQRHAEKEGHAGGEQIKRWYSKKICQICHKTYMNSKVLNKHIKDVHYKRKPFKCSVCGHSTSCKNMLKMHMRQHTGEKPFQCEFCTYRTGDHNTLHRHRRTHTKEYPYFCTLCPYKCIQSGALRAHIKSRHQ